MQTMSPKTEAQRPTMLVSISTTIMPIMAPNLAIPEHKPMNVVLNEEKKTVIQKNFTYIGAGHVT